MNEPQKQRGMKESSPRSILKDVSLGFVYVTLCSLLN